MKDRLIMVLSCNLLTLTGCASTSTLEWLRDEHANAIAEDLVIAVASRVPPTEAPVFVADMPLRDHFESAIREHGYAVSVDPHDSIVIGGIGERIPPNTWHIGLTIDDGIRIHRLYHVKRDDVRALTAISVFDVTDEPQQTDLAESSQWQLRTRKKQDHNAPSTLNTTAHVEQETDTRLTTTGSPLPVVDLTAPQSASTEVSDCPSLNGAVFTLPPGSLQQAVESTLKRCGWTLASWPVDPDHAGYVVDWIISRPIFVNASSINTFLDRIEHSYGLVTARDPYSKTVSVSIDH